MNKLIKSKKGLSPVVAAIILIGVTVAVSIAVAAWMGSMAVSDMKVSELTITSLEFNAGDAENGEIIVHVSNTGTSDVTVHRIRVNGDNVGTWSADISNTIRAGTSETFTSTLEVAKSSKYSVMLFSIDGTMVGSYTDTA
jgi:flagellin-like protein